MGTVARISLNSHHYKAQLKFQPELGISSKKFAFQLLAFSFFGSSQKGIFGLRIWGKLQMILTNNTVVLVDHYIPEYMIKLR